MPVHALSLSSLKDLDNGKVLEALNVHLKRVATDCMDRPGDDRPRSVLLQFDFNPIIDEDGSCSEVKGRVQIKSKVPTHRTKLYSFGLRRNGILVFNEDSPDNINQTTFLEEDED